MATIRAIIPLRCLNHHLGPRLGVRLCAKSCLPVQSRQISTATHLFQVQKEKPDDRTAEIDVQRERPYEHLTFGQKVARAGADFSYLLIIAAGIGVTGILFYTLGSELFSKSGPNSVYTAAVKKCKNSTEVCDCLGAPLTAHGEGRRRRQHIQHYEFVTNSGEKHTRIQFHLKGQFRTAIVHAETFIDESGNREFEYLIVECEGYPPRAIQLEKRVKPKISEPVTFY